MKNHVTYRLPLALAVGLAFSTPLFHSATAESAAVSVTAPVKLPYGVEDVLKLTRAKVAEDTVISFIQNSGTAYNLEANDVVYLRNEGVSDRVISAMIEQRRKFTETLAQPTQSATQPAPVIVSPPPANATDPAPAQSQPAPVYVQPPPTPPPSSVYVVPYPPATYAYYGYYGYPYRPYYPYRYYYGGPSISLGFRFGGGHFGHWGGGWGHHHRW